MNADRVRSRTGLVLLSAVALLATACGGSGSGHGGSGFIFVTINKITTNSGSGAANSSLDDSATSTAVCVTFANNLKNPTVTAPTSLDNVTITTYTVSFTRFDGGEPPGPFTINTAFTVPAGTISGTPAVPTSNTVNVLVVLVPAQAKRQPPLDSLPRLPLSTTAEIVFKGRDGRGQKHEVQGAITVNFIGGVETEAVPTCT